MKAVMFTLGRPGAGEHFAGDQSSSNVSGFLAKGGESYDTQYVYTLRTCSNIIKETPESAQLTYRVVTSALQPATSGTSLANPADQTRYAEIELELVELSRGLGDNQSLVEIGAINTARAVLSYLQSTQIPPPELTSLGHEAIVMLWARGDSTAAVTITDGELGHVVRRLRKTIKRQSNIKPDAFDPLLLA
jgi:hypothetical protein